MATLSELSHRLEESLDVAPPAEGDLTHPEVELRYLRETVRPVLTEYAQGLADSGATQCAGHVVRLLVMVSERVLGADVLSEPSFTAIGLALDDLRALADEWTATGGAAGSHDEPAKPVEPPSLASLEAGAASGGLTTAEMIAGLSETLAWLEEPAQSFTDDVGAGLMRRIDAVSLAPRADHPTMAEVLRTFELRRRCHERLDPVATT